MQTSADGEYIPTKELDTSFKIPKKKPKSPTQQTPVMENSYYNLTAEPPAPQFQFQAAQSMILQNLQKQEYERPKTYSNHILQDTIPDLFDDTLPRELVTQFQPLFCKLCAAQLSSNIVAKLHYKSKNHEKKIKKFLTEYSERTGTPIHPRAKIPVRAKDVEGDDANPLYFYCDVCDLPLTGKLHAESHYMGRNHRKAVLGAKKPAGKGHFDSAGKWIRESKKRPLEEDDGFGNDFRKTEPPAPGVACFPPPTTGFRCEICNITTTCKDQLQCHYNGQKHKKKLKQCNLDQSAISPVFDSALPPEDNILSSVMIDTSKTDVSVYRTPSGQFYCPVCNSTMNSEVQFKQHLQSKNHLKKASQKRT